MHSCTRGIAEGKMVIKMRKRERQRMRGKPPSSGMCCCVQCPKTVLCSLSSRATLAYIIPKTGITSSLPPSTLLPSSFVLLLSNSSKSNSLILVYISKSFLTALMAATESSYKAPIPSPHSPALCVRSESMGRRKKKNGKNLSTKNFTSSKKGSNAKYTALTVPSTAHPISSLVNVSRITSKFDEIN